MCMRICMHVCMHVCMYASSCNSASGNVFTFIIVYTYTYTCVHAYSDDIYMFEGMWMRMCTFITVYIHMYICRLSTLSHLQSTIQCICVYVLMYVMCIIFCCIFDEMKFHIHINTLRFIHTDMQRQSSSYINTYIHLHTYTGT